MSEAGEGESLSNDPDEAKWDYFREESLLHVFHSLLHKVWDGGISSGQLATRMHELFFYAHQQFIRRYNMINNVQSVHMLYVVEKYVQCTSCMQAFI